MGGVDNVSAEAADRGKHVIRALSLHRPKGGKKRTQNIILELPSILFEDHSMPWLRF